MRSYGPGYFSSTSTNMPATVGVTEKPVVSRKIAFYRVEIGPSGAYPRGSPKLDFRMVLVLRTKELGKTAYMGVQLTHGTVQDSHSSRS